MLLFHAISMATKLHSRYGLQPALDEDPAFADTTIHANSVFLGAKRAMTVTAACIVILELRGPLQAQHAKTLLTDQKTLLPQSLVQVLEKLVGKAPQRAATASGMDTTELAALTT